MRDFLAWLAAEPHAARPGPDYWGWRCLRCSEAVADRALHPPLWRRRRARLAWLAARPPLPRYHATTTLLPVVDELIAEELGAFAAELSDLMDDMTRAAEGFGNKGQPVAGLALMFYVRKLETLVERAQGIRGRA